MSNKMTESQEKAVDAYGLEMLQNGIKCGIKTNRKLAESAITVLYKKYLGISEPKDVVFVDSPEAAIKVVASSTKQTKQSLVSEIQFLNLWTWWVAYYSAGIRILGETEGVEEELISDLNEYEDICKSIHALLPCENICFVIEYPKTVSTLNDDLDKFILHRDGGLAIEYQDGTGFSWLNGVAVPDWVALDKPEKISVKKLLAESNVDIRREGLRKVSLARLLKETKARLLDKVKDTKKGKYWDYELYSIDLGDNKKRICLRMYDEASKAYPVERVEDSCTTVLEALAMRDGENKYIPPSIRT